jgi:CheY-like chemotaxis protein
MDNRQRLLLVEDVQATRESYIENLELTGKYRVDGAANLEEAFEATDKCAYHVALIDIMLAGPRDVANRDGVKIAERIQHLAEGTRVIMLSAQKAETEIVGNLIQEYGVFKYVDKRRIEEDGIAGLLEDVDRAAKASSVASPTWEMIAHVLAPTLSEPELVSDIITKLKFSGGIENLGRTLVHNARNLVPLLRCSDPAHGFAFNDQLNVFAGCYWSKGQGRAVEIAIGGKNSSDELQGDSKEALLDREKGGLRLLVTARPELDRSAFVAALASDSRL